MLGIIEKTQNSFKKELKNWHAFWQVKVKTGMPFGTLAAQIQKLARFRHVSMFIGTLARKNEKLARFWHVGT